MRIHRFGGPEVLVADEVVQPRPGPMEVLVRVVAAGVNPVDWKTRGGKGIAGLLGPPPLTLGWDVSGVVEEIGPGVTRFGVDDAVCGMVRFPEEAAAYADYVAAPSQHLVRKPSELSHLEAAGLPLAGLTAWQALVDVANVREGQRVVIHGAGGGVGHLAVQIAKAVGAQVVATASATKHDFVRRLGADDVIDYEATNFELVIHDADIVLDTLGGDNVRRSLHVVRPGGLVISLPSGVTDEDTEEAAKAGVRVESILVKPDCASLEKLCSMAARKRLHVEVDRTFHLEDAGKAHDFGERSHLRGKLVLAVGD